MRALFAFALLAAAAARAAAPPIVYVNDVVAADPSLATDAEALTSPLCGAMAKDKRVEVLCAADVKQLLAFAATTSMVGTSSPALETLQQRVNSVQFVVSGRLALDKGAKVLTMSIGPKDEGSGMGGMAPSSSVLSITEKVGARTAALFDGLPTVARRLIDAAVSPSPASSPAALPATPPTLSPPPTPTTSSTAPSTPAAPLATPAAKKK
jgi:hypothetical protein